MEAHPAWIAIGIVSAMAALVAMRTRAQSSGLTRTTGSKTSNPEQLHRPEFTALRKVTRELGHQMGFASAAIRRRTVRAVAFVILAGIFELLHRFGVPTLESIGVFATDVEGAVSAFALIAKLGAGASLIRLLSAWIDHVEGGDEMGSERKAYSGSARRRKGRQPGVAARSDRLSDQQERDETPGTGADAASDHME